MNKFSIASLIYQIWLVRIDKIRTIFSFTFTGGSNFKLASETITTIFDGYSLRIPKIILRTSLIISNLNFAGWYSKLYVSYYDTFWKDVRYNN